MKFTTRHPKVLFETIGSDFFSQLLTACPGGEAEFRARYQPMAERLAMTVQELPLEKSVFSYPGGALQYGLLCGLTALRLSDGVIFDPQATAQKRMIVEPQYKYAAWCAALSGVPLLVHHLSTINVSGNPWSFASNPSSLWEACGEHGEYEMDWKPVSTALPSATLGIVLLKEFFFHGQFDHFDHQVLAGMCQAVNPSLSSTPGESSLSRVVRLAQEKVKAAELLRMSQVFSSSSPPSDRVSELMVLMQGTPDEITTVTNELQPTGGVHASTAYVPTESGIRETAEQVAIPTKITSWVRAVVADESLSKQFRFQDSLQMVDVTIEQLRFGGSATAMFKTLEEGGFVHSKVASTSARLNTAMATYIKLQLTKQGK